MDIRHPGLGTYQRISGTDQYVVEQRARAKMREWEQRWERLHAAERARAERERVKDERQRAREEERAYRERRKAEADDLTAETSGLG